MDSEPPVTIRITGYRPYEVGIQIGKSSWSIYRINLSERDVQRQNTRLRKALQALVSTDKDSSQHDKYLRNLAELGNSTLKYILPTGNLRSDVQRVLQGQIYIEIDSVSDFSIPWELLYDGPLRTIDINGFWGMRHVINRTLTKENIEEGWLNFDPTIECSNLRIGLIANSELASVRDEKLNILAQEGEKPVLDLQTLTPLDPEERRKGLELFSDFLKGDFHFAHFACHAHSNGHLKEPSGDFQEVYLKIDDDFTITADDLNTVDNFSLAQHPFVILNACSTGSVNPLYTFNWVDTFWKSGARGILATEFEVPDNFAASFSNLFYKRLLNGDCIGDILLSIRKQFWRDRKNPLGLGYSLYGRPDIKIANDDYGHER